MDIKSISALLKFAPEISNKYFNYLTTKSQADYNKLDVALKAYGFTIQQLFDNIDSESFIKLYQSTNAINASISVIQNSTEFTDKEKCEKLKEIHKQEISQQNRAQKYETSKKFINTISIVCILFTGGLVVKGVTYKKHIPIITSKTHNPLLSVFKSKNPSEKYIVKK